MSNFAFLRAEWPELFAEAARAERNGVADPRACCFYARRCLELAVGNYLTEHGVMDPGRLYESPFTEIAPQGPESLFSGSDIDALIAVLDQVRVSAGGTGAA